MLKRGKTSQSNIIIVALLVLIALTAVALVWMFLNSFIKTNIEESKIKSDSLSIDLQIRKALVDTSTNKTLLISIFRGQDSAQLNFSSIKFILKDSSGNTYSYIDTSTVLDHKPLEVKDYILEADNIPGLDNFSSIVYIEISRGITTSSVNIVYSSIADSYGYDTQTGKGNFNEKIQGAVNLSVNSSIITPPINPPSPRCGNNIVEPGEACDGSNVNGLTCSSVAAGFKSGTLSCNADCKSYNVNNCVAGNVINAASCSQVDVQNAINDASDGDIVVVPEGSCTW